LFGGGEGYALARSPHPTTVGYSRDIIAAASRSSRLLKKQA